ncbi:hypothetical protein [Phenylobacterium sp.]|uniref:hypothetical protein n=1 Tax=Phenylobacterium sp. TaxID=1871053 RepID=UPI0027346BA6|nr:hypothetical protein [Phenylobacterium sp.]MDP3854641.1 hypothetical protein [Phenylobacterium sp.]
MRGFLIGLAAFGTLAACDKPLTVPGTAGVCWRLAERGSHGKPEFRPLAPGVSNLESCAVTLEALHLRSGVDVTGGFQGRYIFVTQADITAASGAKTQRYRVFSPEQRAKVRQGIQTLQQRARTGG